MTFRKAAFLAGAGVLLGIPAFASADFSWDFNTVVTGDTPSGAAPWATLAGVTSGSDVNFTLTFNDNGADADEFLKQLDLAYTGGFGASSTLNTGSASITGFDFGSLTDAGNHYDLKIDFSTKNDSNRVNPGEVVTFTITDASADAFTTGLLHINNTPGQQGSGKVAPGAVPEPASMAVLGLGALGLIRRRRNK